MIGGAMAAAGFPISYLKATLVRRLLPFRNGRTISDRTAISGKLCLICTTNDITDTQSFRYETPIEQ